MIVPDRSTFFSATKSRVFGGSMSQSQVDGVNAVLDAWEAASDATDPRWVAYALGTDYHETGATMQPIAEYGKGAGRPYGQIDPQTGHAYYGRGLVQLTWKANYATMSKVVGVDLVKNPDLALQPKIAAEIMTAGMTRGLFTGRKLIDFFVGTRSDWTDARTIINGHDRAALVASYALGFYHAITEG